MNENEISECFTCGSKNIKVESGQSMFVDVGETVIYVCGDCGDKFELLSTTVKNNSSFSGMDLGMEINIDE